MTIVEERIWGIRNAVEAWREQRRITARQAEVVLVQLDAALAELSLEED